MKKVNIGGNFGLGYCTPKKDMIQDFKLIKHNDVG